MPVTDPGQPALSAIGALLACRHAPLDMKSAGCRSRALSIAVVQDTPATDPGQPAVSAIGALLAVARSMVPDNVMRAAVDSNILGVITFSLLFGLALAALGPQADSFIGAVHVRCPRCRAGYTRWAQRA